MKNLKVIAAIGSLVWLHITAPASVEIVQSIPVETALHVPGIRDARSVWLQMIGQAKTSIDLEHFYITDGEPLTEILTALRNISKTVRVRLIVDNNFYQKYPEGPDSVAATTTIEVRSIDFSPGIQHAKYFIVDGHSAFVGSQNLDWRALIHIHEVGAWLAKDPAVGKIQAIFDRDWSRAKPIGRSHPRNLSTQDFFSGTSQLRIVASPASQNPKGVDSSLDAIVELLGQAKKAAFVELMDYSPTLHDGPWTVLERALRAAALRGVKVRLLLDHGHYLKAKPAVDLLVQHGVGVKSVIIPEHSSGPIPYARLIHAKYLIVDDRVAWLGSENWAGGYFENCRNVGLVTAESHAVNSLGKIFAKVWNSPYAQKR